MRRFIIKKSLSSKPLLMVNEKREVIETKVEKNIEDMDTQEKIMMANAVLNQTDMLTKVKKVRKDKGLIEKTESSKIILTEDNRELLND
jgi:hypothetical protein